MPVATEKNRMNSSFIYIPYTRYCARFALCHLLWLVVRLLFFPEILTYHQSEVFACERTMQEKHCDRRNLSNPTLYRYLDTS